METKEESSTSNILVICRFRPLNSKELEQSSDLCVSIEPDNQNLKINSQYELSEPLKFCFDYVFAPDATQELVYQKAARPIISAVLQGFNGTVFAYGQTSSGKTFTMTGISLTDPNEMGIIPRMISTVFDEIFNSDPNIEYTVKVSYCEIYMEHIRDLLDTSKERLKIHEDKTRGVFIAELTEKYVSSESEVYEIMKFGLENRNIGYTDMNAVSSRSHSIFSVTISQTNKRDYISKTGKLYLVDLAGSEKVGKTNAAGKRLEEAKNINKSLTMLGLVIYSLTDGKASHIPYRDSKLTRVLQDSLGGNAKTSLIITCSPSPCNEAETISTLRFGMRAKSIKNKPVINREFTVAELKLMLAKCREELSKRDKRIKFLEDSMNSPTSIERKGSIEVERKEGAEIERKEEGVSCEEGKNEYDEIIAELEDTRNKLAEEVKASDGLRMKLAMNLDELDHYKAVSEVIRKKNESLKQIIGEHEKQFDRKNNEIESLGCIKEALEKEVHTANNKILELEGRLNEKAVYQSETKATDKSGLNELKELLKRERELNTKSESEILVLRNNLNEVLNKKCPELKVQQIMKEVILRKDSDKLNDERKSMIKDLQKRVDRIIELEMALDDSKNAYKTLESYMSEGERALKRKLDTLERNLEQLTLMYHQLITQKSQISVENTLAEKKLSRVNTRIKKFEEDLAYYKEALEQSEQKCAILQEELSLLQVYKDKYRGNNMGNIKKTIQSRRAHTRIHSMTTIGGY